jgi:hypothetical protein
MKFPGARLAVPAVVAITFAMLLAGRLAAQSKPDPAQPPPLEPAEGRRQAKLLVDNLLSLQPSENVTQTLFFRRFDSEDRKTEVPVIFEFVRTPTNFLSIYRTTAEAKPDAGMKLVIPHAPSERNQYFLSQPPDAAPRQLGPKELCLPFAGSDFWVADLGLDFLQWPQQRVIRKQMRKSVFCDMLESINPQPGSGGYSKVVSWIGANHPDELVIVHADAYDDQGKLLKQFDPRKLERVNGAYQLEEMEIRNRQTRTRTKVEFQLR